MIVVIIKLTADNAKVHVSTAQISPTGAAML
jgi:hypothetical protein